MSLKIYKRQGTWKNNGHYSSIFVNGFYKWGGYLWYLIGVRKCDIYYSWYFTLFGIMFCVYMFWFYFLSSKFSRKLNFVESLAELAEIVPLEQASIPDRVKQWVFYLISLYFSIKSNVFLYTRKFIPDRETVALFRTSSCSLGSVSVWIHSVHSSHREVIFVFSDVLAANVKCFGREV